jgi:thiol-disulfide isomerase/thioredoxin
VERQIRARRLVLAGSIVTGSGAGLWPSGSAKAQAGAGHFLLGGATGWLNSPALTSDSLRGKVVLIDVCTYTCINWLRTLPYVRAWSEKYKNQGLIVLGVHSPEFEFEKKVDNVRWAAANMRVDYPIAVDSDFAVWRALRNSAWPCRYFVDATGRIRHVQVGEGEYATRRDDHQATVGLRLVQGDVDRRSRVCGC